IRQAVDTSTAQHQVMPDDHSELVPLLPIPNRTVKQLRADDSAGSRVKVGHRQALTALKTPSRQLAGVLSLGGRKCGSPHSHIRSLTQSHNPTLAALTPDHNLSACPYPPAPRSLDPPARPAGRTPRSSPPSRPRLSRRGCPTPGPR